MLYMENVTTIPSTFNPTSNVTRFMWDSLCLCVCVDVLDYADLVALPESSRLSDFLHMQSGIGCM